MRELSTSERFEIVLSIISAICGVIVFIGGVYLFFSDIHDFPKTHHEGKMKESLPGFLGVIREHMHHWQWGLLLIFAGLLISLLSLLKIALILNPELKRKVFEWLKKIEKQFSI